MKAGKLFTMFICLMLFVFAGCGSEEAESEIIPDEPEILTHVYLGDAVSLPEGYDVLTEVTPYYADGIFTVLCRYDSTEYALVSFDTDGKILEDTPVSVVPDGLEINGTVKDGMITADELLVHMGYFSSSPAVRTAYIIRISRTDGSITHSENLIRLFNSPDAETRYYKILGFVRGGDGTVAFCSESELIVLDKNLEHIHTYPSTSWIEGFAVTPDGEITIYGSFSKGTGLYKLNPETKIPDILVETGTDASLTEYLYMPDGTMAYSTDDGLYAVTESGDELLMDYKNSGLTADRIRIYAFADRDTFLGSVSKYGESGVNLQIFRKSDDIVISEIETIDLADLGGLDEYIAALVVDYNLLHRDKRIVITDFGEMENGEMQLMTAIQTGIYHPDIIVGTPESTVLRKIVEEGLYTDLMPYLKADDDLNLDNLFGAVKNLFDDNGKMWGITPKFTVQTVAAPVARLGERTYWSLEELLDYAENLPEDEELIYCAIRSKAGEYILGPAGYRLFVDTDANTSSFDSELFIRYLRFIADLPADYQYYYDNFGDRRLDALHSGKISLNSLAGFATLVSISDWLSMEMEFDTVDYTLIGYPAEDRASAAYVSAESAYVITSFTADPDGMWEVLKALFPAYQEHGYYRIPNGLPALKSVYDAQAEEESKMEYIIHYSGGMVGHSYDPENPMTPEDLEKPGIITYFDAEKAAEMKEYLDLYVGVSVMDTLPASLEEIVTEEISAYLAGRYTAEDCASVIQSRAEIWLSEHE